MAMDQLVEFLAKCDKSADQKLFEDAKKAAPKSADKLTTTVGMLVDVGNKKGYSFTDKDVAQYIQSLATEYYTSSTVRTMMDAFCTTSCHIGSQINKP